MLCNNCGVEVSLGQRACGGCGSSGAPVATDAPTAFTIVEQTDHLPLSTLQLIDDPPLGVVAAAALFDLEPVHDSLPDQERTSRAPAVLAAVAAMAGVASIAGSSMLVATIVSDAPIPQYLGDYFVNDLGGGTNFQAGFILAGALLLFGALLVLRRAHASWDRFGAGLISGAGLALVPFVVFMWASADATVKRALLIAESISTSGGGGRVLESTYAVGFAVLVASAVLGIGAASFAAVRGRSDSEHEPHHTGVCVAAALSSVIAGAGQLIPENGARFIDNFTNSFNSAPHVYSRVGMIAVVAIVATVGFLLASRFGLGLAVGAVSLYVWQWGSSLAGAGKYPAPPALGNPGNITGKPHVVTTVAVVAVVLLGVALAATPARSSAASE